MIKYLKTDYKFIYIYKCVKYSNDDIFKSESKF